MKRSRTETVEALAGVLAAIVGVILVSLAPADLRPLAIVALVVVYVLGYLALGFMRARGPGNRSSR